MELHDALSQIAEIRQQIAQTAVFRGYRSLTVGFSSLLGGLAAVVQAVWIPQPTEQLNSYLSLWIGTALVALLVVGTEMGWRARSNPSPLAGEKTVLAIEQFTPSLVAGGVLTAVIAERASAVAWMLPGLWAIVFSLGVFASYRLLPKAIFLVGLYYLCGGAVALTSGAGGAALSPWSMGLLFGGGQLLAALVLYFTLERNVYVRTREA